MFHGLCNDGLRVCITLISITWGWAWRYLQLAFQPQLHSNDMRLLPATQKKKNTKRKEHEKKKFPRALRNFYFNQFCASDWPVA